MLFCTLDKPVDFKGHVDYILLHFNLKGLGVQLLTGTKVMFPVSGNVQYRAKFPIQFPSHQEILPYTVQFPSVVLTCPFTFSMQDSSGNAFFRPVSFVHMLTEQATQSKQ